MERLLFYVVNFFFFFFIFLLELVFHSKHIFDLRFLVPRQIKYMLTYGRTKNFDSEIYIYFCIFFYGESIIHNFYKHRRSSSILHTFHDFPYVSIYSIWRSFYVEAKMENFLSKVLNFPVPLAKATKEPSATAPLLY